MKTIKGVLLALLAVTCIGTSVVGLSGCSGETQESSVEQNIETKVIFDLNGDGKSYKASGLSEEVIGVLTIPQTYNGLPVTEIDRRAFARYSSLTSVEIPDSVTWIGSSAFEDCDSLESVVIGSRVTTIGNGAFLNCSSLTSIVIGNSVTTIGEMAFYNTGYYKDGRNWENGVLYIGKYLIEANKDTIEESYTIKDGTLYIGDSAFEACSSLTSIEIPDSVTAIEDQAFFNCLDLMSIRFKGTVESWNAISKGGLWKNNVPATEVVCSDGRVAI